MGSGKMENLMVMACIPLIITFISVSLKTELNMAEGFKQQAMVKFMKVYLRLAKGKGKDFYIWKKVSVMKVIFKKESSMDMVDGSRYTVLRNMKGFSKMVRKKGSESFRKKTNSTTKGCLLRIGLMEEVSISQLNRK